MPAIKGVILSIIAKFSFGKIVTIWYWYWKGNNKDKKPYINIFNTSIFLLKNNILVSKNKHK